MDKSGAMEFLMPELTNADLWKESGRWFSMGPEMFRIKDRNGNEYALGPTHEESFTNVVRLVTASYRDLPVNVYQINTKFRDEIRPRYGVIRSKEFIMKDAYSFDLNEAGLDESYEKMRTAYRNIFTRCGLETIPVQADSGNMGGSASEEFMVASDVGEETLLICPECVYRANQEKAQFLRGDSETREESNAITEISTPNVKTIDDLAKFFAVEKKRFLKTIVYMADEKPVIAVVTGDREINEVKLKNAVGCINLELASDEVVEKVTSAPVGFAGPVNNFNVRTIFDRAVKDAANAITGANKKDIHFTGVNPGRDFEIKEDADIVTAVAGDACPNCGKALYEKKGIEVGHIFKLGYKYTKAMGVTVLDSNGKAVTPIMGCYGIGVTRTLAAIVEQHSDEKGIIWPAAIAPFQVHLVGISKTAEEIEKIENIYKMISDLGYDVLYDDRKLSPGIKFADADLIGLPVRITAGKTYFESGKLEVKNRKTGAMLQVAIEDLPQTIRNNLI